MLYDRKNTHIVEESKSTERCFIVLKLSDEIRAEYQCDGHKKQKSNSFPKQFIENPFDHVFLDRLMRNREKYFTFVETLHAEKDNLPPKDISGPDPFQFVFNRFESRFSMELNISLNQLNDLLESLYSKYQGEKFFNPSMVEKFKSRLHNAFFGTHLDIKNKETEKWMRVYSLVKPKPKPEYEDDGCRIA